MSMSWYESAFWIALLIIVIVADQVWRMRRRWDREAAWWAHRPGLSHSIYSESRIPPPAMTDWPRIVRVETTEVAENVWRHDYFFSVALEPAPVDEARTQEVSQ
jgi:hypothetical protein